MTEKKTSNRKPARATDAPQTAEPSKGLHEKQPAKNGDFKSGKVAVNSAPKTKRKYRSFKDTTAADRSQE